MREPAKRFEETDKLLEAYMRAILNSEYMSNYTII